MKMNNLKLVYKAPIFNGVMDVIIAVFLLCVILYVGFLKWQYFIIMVGGLLILLRSAYRVSVYSEKIILNRLLNRNKEILLKDCSEFRNNNGRVSNHFSMEYKSGRKTKSVTFYIIKKKDVEILIEFFKSKNIKVTATAPPTLPNE